MFTWFKRAHDRFFGVGEADTSVPALDGPLKPNDALERAAVFLEREEMEDMCVDASGRLVVACGSELLEIFGSGEQRVLTGLPEVVQAVAPFDDGLVAASLGGLHFIGGRLDGKSASLAGPEAPVCINALCEMSDGSLLISDGSRDTVHADWRRDLMSRGTSGRVLRYLPESGSLEIVRAGMKYCHGVCVDGQGRILASESWAHRIVDVTNGQGTAVYSDLPGYPSRLAPASSGGFWLTLFAPRNQLVELVLREDDFRDEMMRTIESKYWIAPALSSGKDFLEPLQHGGVRQMGILKPWAPPRSYGLVIRLNAQLNPLFSLHSRVGGLHHGVTAVVEHDRALLVLSRGADRILRIPLSELEV